MPYFLLLPLKIKMLTSLKNVAVASEFGVFNRLTRYKMKISFPTRGFAHLYLICPYSCHDLVVD